MTEVYIKEWFLRKMNSENNGYYQFSKGKCIVEKETEKAYLLDVEYYTLDGEDDGVKQKWCPKSCTMTVEEKEAEEKAQEKRFFDGCNRYEKMISFAKDNGVKGVRERMKKETVLNKIKQAGLVYEY